MARQMIEHTVKHTVKRAVKHAVKHAVKQGLSLCASLGSLALPLFLSSACATVTASAAGAASAGPEAQEEKLEIARDERRADTPAVLVILPRTEESLQVYGGLRSELSEDFDLVPLEYTSAISSADVGAAIAKEQPQVVVLINNSSVRLYDQYRAEQEKQGAAAKPVPPAVVVMAAYFGETRPDAEAESTGGVVYEIPSVTLFVQLRSFIDRPVARVGVIHRAGFTGFVEQQRQMAGLEKFELVDVTVPDRPTSRDIRIAVRKLRDQGIDAVWMLNDNALLRTDLITDGWKPALDLAKLPVIVGVKALVNKDFSFGTFALTPDHEALGVQAASMIFDLRDAEWKYEGVDQNKRANLVQPLAVKVAIDVAQARKLHKLKESELSRADFVEE